jgi:hypothetical protein
VFVVTSMQVLLQSICPATLQAQLLLVQTAPAGQAMLQPPQLALLVVVSTQAVPHWVWLPEQLVLQALLLHTCPVVQAWPQVPQLLESEATQALLQLRVPEPQAQAPFVQVWPLPQALPQAPQFCASVWTFLQVPVQAICPEVHVGPVLGAGLAQPPAVIAVSRTAPRAVKRALCLFMSFLSRRVARPGGTGGADDAAPGRGEGPLIPQSPRARKSETVGRGTWAAARRRARATPRKNSHNLPCLPGLGRGYPRLRPLP